MGFHTTNEDSSELSKCLETNYPASELHLVLFGGVLSG